MTGIPDEIMEQAKKLIVEVEGIPTMGTVYVVSRALLAAEKRGREEAAGVAQECSKNVSGPTTREAICAEVASAIRSGS